MTATQQRIVETAEALSKAYEDYVEALIASGPNLDAEQVKLLRGLIPPIPVPSPEITLEQAEALMSSSPPARHPDTAAGELLTPKFHTPAGMLTAHRRERCRVDYCGRIAP